MKEQVDQIMQKRMDRKNFLKHVGMGVVVLTGGAALLRTLKPGKQAMSYGASAYGGKPKA